VDSSPDHSIKDKAYRLWLSDPLALYGVESSMFAPGYRNPNFDEAESDKVEGS
jgi:hypothetical protein